MSTNKKTTTGILCATSYAHSTLLKHSMDHYALAMQMGTSVKMIEQHYGHITPAHIAAKLAGPRMGP